MSQLLESFTTDEGFRMDDDSSFSEGEEEEEEEEEHQHSNTVQGEQAHKPTYCSNNMKVIDLILCTVTSPIPGKTKLIVGLDDLA